MSWIIQSAATVQISLMIRMICLCAMANVVRLFIYFASLRKRVKPKHRHRH